MITDQYAFTILKTIREEIMQTRLTCNVAVALVISATATTLGAQDPVATRNDSAANGKHASATVGDSVGVEQRVADLERKLRDLQQAAQKTAPPAVKVASITAGKEGFSLRAPDGDFQLKIRGYFQSDGRFFSDDEQRPGSNTFLLRRVRPIFEATVYKFVDFRFMPDFGEGRTQLLDAHMDLNLNPALVVRAGKFKPPVGLERLQSATDLLFVERGLPTNLVPSRDVGVQVHGNIKGGVLSYALGLFNGTTDLGSGDADNGNHKDAVVRIFAKPFGTSGPKLLQELGLGASATRGNHRGTPSASFLPGYRSNAQQNFFAYRNDASAAGSVIASGEQTRFSPQAYWYAGPFGLLAEYVRSTQEVQRASIADRLDHSAWQVAGSVVLTRERASYRGVTPASPFNPAAHKWGAVELAARVGRLTLDADAFPVFADSTSQASAARAYGVGLNWYLARGIRLMLDYEQTRFSGGARSGDRETEKVILTRLQHSF
ncbi:MAG: porin [Anaerolineae bacterium]|nr:porin [Gemmatimonadaceae bacterium]